MFSLMASSMHFERPVDNKAARGMLKVEDRAEAVMRSLLPRCLGVPRSSAFSAMGVPDMQLEFFPQGQASGAPEAPFSLTPASQILKQIFN